MPLERDGTFIKSMNVPKGRTRSRRACELVDSDCEDDGSGGSVSDGSCEDSGDDVDGEGNGGGDEDPEEDPEEDDSDAAPVRPPRGRSLAKNWCFTLNNYRAVDELTALPAGVVYCIYGREVAESGTRHLQGFMSLDSRQRLSFVTRIFGGRAHWEVARNVPRSIQYCKKEGDFRELGVPPSSGSKRKELDLFKDAVRAGNHDHKRLREDFSNIYARYSRFAHQYVLDHAPQPELQCHPLYVWQGELYRILSRRPDGRKIYFVVDQSGDKGKSWFALYTCDKKENVQVMKPGKKADMSHALNQDTRILFVDIPKCKSEYLQYDFLEEVKDGLVFSSKYESHMMRMHPCHVVVLMNEMPNEEKLSRDRYIIWQINGDGSYTDRSPI